MASGCAGVIDKETPNASRHLSTNFCLLLLLLFLLLLHRSHVGQTSTASARASNRTCCWHTHLQYYYSYFKRNPETYANS